MYVVAVLFNYPWERVQSSLYVGMDGANAASWLCLLASLIDGLVIFAAGCIIFRRRDWFKNPGISGYVLMVVTGFMISIGVEWTTLYLGQWGSTRRNAAPAWIRCWACAYCSDALSSTSDLPHRRLLEPLVGLGSWSQKLARLLNGERSRKQVSILDHFCPLHLQQAEIRPS